MVNEHQTANLSELSSDDIQVHIPRRVLKNLYC